MTAQTDSEFPQLRHWGFPELELRLFRAKWLGAPWSSTTFLPTVRETREGYRRAYGDSAPLFDEYDNKAAIYVVQASYAIEHSRRCVEWFAMRLVPALGTPELNEDLSFYRSQSRNVLGLAALSAQALPELSEQSLLRGAYSCGRMAAVRPRCDSGWKLSSCRAVGLGWLCVLDQFRRDLAACKDPCHLLTVQMTEALAARCPDVPVVHFDVACGLKRGDIVLNRQNTELRQFCYKFPAYFLEPTSCARFLESLLLGGMLNTSCIQALLPPGRELSEFFRSPRFQDLKAVGRLLGANGEVEGSKLTGEELRKMADQGVQDAPSLRIVPQVNLSVALARLESARSVRLVDGVYRLEVS